MSETTKFLGKKAVYLGKHLDFMEAHFQTDDNQTYVWEYVSRKNLCRAASVIVHNKDEFILIKEYRQVVQRYAINFPAGLIDPGEDEVDAAKREFEEETGLQLINPTFSVFGPSLSSAGLTNEKVYTVLFDLEHLHSIGQKLDPSENIKVLRVPSKGLLQTLINMTDGETEIGSRLLNFAIGFDYGQKLHSR